MKNRYDDILRDYNQQILELTPANQTLRVEMAYQYAQIAAGTKALRAIDVGCGEGDSLETLLRITKGHIDALDVSAAMIALCKRRLQRYASRIHYVCEDANTFLKHCAPYNVIVSTWTLHNFPWTDKKMLLQSIYNALTPGGTFLLMDKVYPERGAAMLYRQQIRRYNMLLPAPRKAIVAHEKIDYSARYRMLETQLLSMLQKMGFRKIQILDRIDRDCIIQASR